MFKLQEEVIRKDLRKLNYVFRIIIFLKSPK